MNKIETSRRGIPEETKLSAEELDKQSNDLFDLSLATLRSLPGFLKKYKKPGVVNFPRLSFLHNGLRYITGCRVAEGRQYFTLIEFSGGINTHILISSNVLNPPEGDPTGSIGYHRVPLFGSREKLVSFKDSFEATKGIRDFWAKF